MRSRTEMRLGYERTLMNAGCPWGLANDCAEILAQDHFQGTDARSPKQKKKMEKALPYFRRQT